MTPTPMAHFEIEVEPFKQLVNDSITDAFNDPEFQLILALIIAALVASAIIAGIGNALRPSRRR